MLTKKQQEVVDCVRREDPQTLICAGAKRAGKTFILILVFLAHIAKFADMSLNFILAGANLASLRRNVLNDMENLLGKQLKLDRTNCVQIFGNRVYCFEGANSDTWKKVRGFTAAGAFLNEATALHDSFIKEVFSRCSYPGARIYMDTNPENPMHAVKRDYIDKDGAADEDGNVLIRAFSFTLFDNDTLTQEYIRRQIELTPSGMYTERDIYGRWVAAEGVVYPDFHEDLYIDNAEGYEFSEYFVGVDWGYEHFGAMVLFGYDGESVVLIEEHAKRHEEIDYYLDVARDIKRRFGNVRFYCDSARPEYVQKLRNKGFRAVNANKSILAGIEAVARLIKTRKFFVVKEAQRFREEINTYVWNPTTGLPVKLNDDVMDAVRYAVYTHFDDSRQAKVIDRKALYN